jgi:hypothetical protein
METAVSGRGAWQGRDGMKTPRETDSCEAVQSYYSYYTIPQTAVLWCKVPPAQVRQIVEQAEEVARNIYRHPAITCLERRCSAIHDAIDNDKLPCGRDGRGRSLESQDHVAPERRTITCHDLKEWIAKEFPGDKPPFLFDDIERTNHYAISADAYRALKADHDKLTARQERAKGEYQKLRHEKEGLERTNQSLTAITEKANTPGERAETTYLNIIGAMLDLMLTKSPGWQAHSIFTTQSAVIQALNIVPHNNRVRINAVCFPLSR